MSLYLNVPYAEKEEAKRLGAKWDSRVKKWYTDAPRGEYVRFAKWLLRDTDDVIIAAEYLLCGKWATVPTILRTWSSVNLSS